MKRALILVLFPLFLIGVFGDEVSVKEGESVTLHTDLTEILKDDVIDWRFNETRIAKISSGSKGISEWITDDVAFRARLQLDSQTGDLTITDLTTTDSGEYKLQITRTTSSEKTFSVNVVASADRDAVSVMVGDSVTLNTEIQTDDVIRWRFGPQNSPIAEINRKTRNVSTHDGPDERFMGKLKLDYWTGSLTISNIGTNHSGLYEVDISRSGYTIHKSFSVTVSDEIQSVSVTEGESVTLNTGLTEIQRDNEILWKFKNTHIAHIIKADEQFHTFDERFRDRLQLDNQTGSLTITKSKFTDFGLYEVTIRDSKYTVLKSIPVTVIDVKSVMEGGSVHLQTGVTEIQKDAQILWKFKNQVIPTDRLKDPKVATTWSNIDLNKQTGDLNITNIRTNQFGDYKVEIITGSVILHKKFLIKMTAVPDSGPSAGAAAGICVAVFLLIVVGALAGAVMIYYRRQISELKSQRPRMLSVFEGESVTLIPDAVKINDNDGIQWKKEGALIAVRTTHGEITVHDDVLDGRFKNGLNLDKDSGSLTITNTRTTDTGYYELWIIRQGHELLKIFRVSVDPEDNRNSPEDVPLMNVGVSNS